MTKEELIEQQKEVIETIVKKHTATIEQLDQETLQSTQNGRTIIVKLSPNSVNSTTNSYR